MLQKLVSRARLFEKFQYIHGISVGHYNNGRNVGYIDIDFDCDDKATIEKRQEMFEKMVNLPSLKKEEVLKGNRFVTIRFFYEEGNHELQN